MVSKIDNAFLGDEASVSMLKILDQLESNLDIFPVSGVIRTNCFTDGDDCEHVHTYPTFQFSNGHKTMQTGALTWKQLLKIIYT
jgi:hypothetical protein